MMTNWQRLFQTFLNILQFHDWLHTKETSQNDHVESFWVPHFSCQTSTWNTVNIDGSVSDELLKQWIDDSYGLVVSKMSKKLQKELENL